MNYQQSIDFLFAQLPMYQREGKSAYKEDIGNIIKLCKELGNPQEKFKTIHIGGTNGKGSTSHFLTSVFIEAGYQVGTYTSPHYLDFRERIKINGEYVSEQFVIGFVERIKNKMSIIQPSFFEITVAMAFEYFAQQQVDIAIIEVGLGGRLDSTNIIMPQLSVITNISLDHQKFLGETLPQIAREKAGIIKANTPVVIGKTQAETIAVFKRFAKQNNAPIFFADQLAEVKRAMLRGLVLTTNDKTIEINTTIGGQYQLENITTAYVAFLQLQEQFELRQEHFTAGIERLSENTPIIGRWQVLGEQPLFIADSCHNEAGIKSFVTEITRVNQGQLHLIYGAASDKDVADITKLLPPNAQYYLTEAQIPRRMPVDVLQEYFVDFEQVKGFSDVELALNMARASAQPNDTIAVFGSIFLIADVLKIV